MKRGALRAPCAVLGCVALVYLRAEPGATEIIWTTDSEDEREKERGRERDRLNF